MRPVILTPVCAGIKMTMTVRMLRMRADNQGMPAQHLTRVFLSLLPLQENIV